MQYILKVKHIITKQYWYIHVVLMTRIIQPAKIKNAGLRESKVLKGCIVYNKFGRR